MLLCIDLRTRCFIIGYFVLVTKSVKILYNTSILWPLIIVYKEIESFGDGTENYFKSVIIISSVEIFISFLDLLSTIILIIGLHKSNCKLVLVFLESTVIFFILGLLLFLSGVGISAGKYDKSDWLRCGFEVVYKCAYLVCLHIIRKYFSKLRQIEEATCVYNSSPELSDPEYVA